MANEESDRYRSIDVCHIWGRDAASEAGKLLEQIRFTDGQLSRIAGTAQDVAHKGGFAAEMLHAESFNCEAILNNKDVRALTGQHPGASLSKTDSTTDILLKGGGEPDTKVQLKYYRNAEETQKALRATKDGIPKYREADQHVVPSDQIEGVRDAARKTQARNTGRRGHVVDAAREVEAKASSTLERNGVRSRELTLDDARKVGAGDDDGKAFRRELEGDYLGTSTAKQAWKAAKSAAMISTIAAGTVNTVRCLKLVECGQMATDEAIRYILFNTSIAAADAAIKAGAATTAVSVAARSIPALFEGSMFQSSLSTGAVAGAAICAVDLVECIVLVAAGRMTPAEVEERTGKNLFQTSAAVVGSSIGAAVCAPAGPVGIYLGSAAGGLIASLATSLAIDNHIEEPYRQTLAMAQAQVGSMNLLANSSALFALSEKAFVEFRIGVLRSEDELRRQMQRIDEQNEAIARILGRI